MAEYEIPIPWYHWAAARDPRAYDLLVQGLHSENLMIVTWAAKGLAALQNPKAIDQLIAAGRHSHGEGRVAIALSLVYFAEPKAQTAAEQFSDAYAIRHDWEILRDDALAKGPKSLFRW